MLYQHFLILRIEKCSKKRFGKSFELDKVEDKYQLALGIQDYLEQNLGISSSSVGILHLQGIEGIADYNWPCNVSGFWASVIYSSLS